MTLSILDCILDEEFRATQTGTGDDNDVSAATYTASSFATAVNGLSLSLLTSPSGFPQYAERTNFVSSSNPVTNYFLTSSATGTPFPAGGTATDLYVGSNRIFLFATTDPNIVVGRVGNGATANPTGQVAVIIGIEETITSGFVTSADLWIVQRAPLIEDGLNQVDSLDELDLSGLIYLGSNFDTTTNIPFDNFDDVASGNNLFNVIFANNETDDVQLLLTGSTGETLSTVNVSTTGIGAGSQHIEVGTTLRIDAVAGMIQANVDQAPDVNNSDNIDYSGRVELSGADFEITQVNPGASPERVDIILSAFNAAGASQEGTYLTDAIASDGVPVEIDAADVRILDDAGNDITAAWLALAGTEIIQMGNSVKIVGLNDGATNSTTDGDRVAFTTDGVRFDRFLITNADGDDSTFDVGNIHVTATRGGADTEYGELGSHLIYQDDGPKIVLSGTTPSVLVADEETYGTNPNGSFAGMFTPDYGADANGTVGYTLGISSNGAVSGLIDTATGNGVFLFLLGGKVVGKEGTNLADAQNNGDVVFEISVLSDGTVSLDQQRAVVHGTNPGEDELTPAMTSTLITLTGTAYDSEATGSNDSAQITANIGNLFQFRDDGPVLGAQLAGSGTPNNLVIGNTNGATDSSAFFPAAGGDGQKSLGFLNPDSTGDFRWAYFDWDGVGGAGNYEIKGTYKGADLYKIILNSDGTYTMTMIGTLPSSTLNLNTAEIKAGGPDTNSIEVGAIENAQFVRITGDSTAGAGNINESNAFVGVDNGNLDVGETLSFTLHEENGTPINFSGISIGTKSAQASKYHVVAHLVGGGVYETDITIGKNGILIVDPPGSALVTSIDVTKLTGSATKIGLGDIDILIPPNDVTLSFDVRLTDGDNDFANQSFTVSIDGNNSGTITNPVQGLVAPNIPVSEPVDLSVASVGIRVEPLNFFHGSSDWLM